MTSPSISTSLTSRDIRAIALWALAALVGLIIVLRYHDAAFPSASIDFRVTRDEAETAAADFLRGQGHDPATYRAVTTFDYDDIAKVYLERELGLETANTLMKSEVTVWQWHTRFFRPGEQEEFLVSINPSGRLVGFDHEIEERRAGANLPLNQAQAIAERFLTETPALILEEYRLVEGETRTRDNRADHTFTWERRSFKARDATARVTVTIQGDRIGGYAEYLKVPEAWQRDFTQLRSRNTLTQQIAEVFLYGVIIALLVVFVRELGRRRLTWGFGVQCGAVLALTSLALSLNTLPLAFAEYKTTQSLAGFYGIVAFSAAMGASGWFLFISLIGATSVSVYRSVSPEKLAPEWLLTGGTVRSKEYFMASVVGYLIPLVMLGYITAFYLITGRFGAWSPADIDYSDMASTTFPWLYPLTIGLQSSIFEEFVFRLFAISFLKRYLKSTFWAIVIPAVIWGFLHSNYPQQPFFIRGLEISAVGVLLGMAFLRYGILCTIIAHYAYNALLISLFLFQSPRLYFQVSAGLVVGLLLIPLVPSLIALVRRRLTYDPARLNGAVEQRLAALTSASPVEVEATSQPQITPEPPAPYRPLSRRVVIGIIGCAALMVLLMAQTRVDRFLDFLDLRIDRDQAITRAVTYLSQRGVDTAPYNKVATFSRATEAGSHRWGIRYIREQEGVSRLNNVYRTRLNAAAWDVRFFIPLQKEEYHVLIGPDGGIVGYDHQVEETAPGDTLSHDAALAFAWNTLRGQGRDLTGYKLVESNQERRDARIDHNFVWEDSLTVIKEGRFRIQATVQGGEVVRMRPFFKAPEAWIREQEKTTFKDIAIAVLTVFIVGGLVVLAMRIFMQQIRQRRINWRLSLTVTAVITILSLVEQVNTSSSMYASYRTAMSLENFLAQQVILAFVVAAVGLMIVGMVLFGFAESLYRLSWPEKSDIPSWFGTLWRFNTPESRRRWRDALILGYAACILAPGLRHLLNLGKQMLDIPSGRLAPGMPYTGSYTPEMSVLLNAATGGLLGCTLLLTVILVARYYFPRPVKMAGVAVLVMAALQATSADTLFDFTVQTAEQMVVIGVAWFCIHTFWRDNLAAYVLTFFLISLTGDAWVMFSGSSEAYRAAGVRTLLLAALPLVVWVWGVRVRR